MSDQHEITLRAMRFHALVGILPHERTNAQPIEIDLTVRVTAGTGDRVVDYRALYALVAQVVSAGPIDYLEEIAEAVVRHALGGFGDAYDIPDQALADIKLAVTEACTNVVVHAYPDGDGPLGVSAWMADERLTVVVHDEGRGMLPRPDSPGLGLGLPLIATLAESLELGTGSDERTEVRMTFLLDDNEAAA